MMNSDDSTPLVFSLVCRTCLKNYSDLISIFDSKAAHMLIYCDFSTVSEGDGLPDQICLNCIQILKQSYTFKQLCEKSEVTLRKTLTENINSHSQDPLFSYKKGEFSDKLQFVSEKNIEDCNNQDNSLDSSDITDDVVKNELSHHEYTSEYAEIFKNENMINIESEKNKDDTAVRDDLISFLEKPLPPPLPYQCQHCSQSFTEENDLKIHQSVHNSELICLACRKTFTGRQMLKRHLKIHLIKKPHLCKMCNKSYSESHALTKHLRRHSGIPREKKHFCSECGQGFSEPYYLKVHMRKHTGERPLVCTECDKRFADPRSYKIHAMIHSGERPYTCNFCMKTFVQNANLTKHLRVHTGEKPYSCKLCDKRFSQSSSLDKHVRTHTGEKIHTCSRCDKRYSDKTALKKHEKIHQEGQKYDCRQCCVSFMTKSELVLHCKEHCEVKKKLCGKKFSSRANLQEHVHTHSKEKSFECNIYY